MNNAARPQPAAPSSTRPSGYALYWWTLRFLKPYAGIVLLLIGCDLLLTLVQLSIPRLVGRLIDVVLPGRDAAAFGTALLTLACLFAAGIAVSVCRNMWSRIVGEKPGMDVQARALDQLRLLGIAYYEQNPAGSTLSLLQADVAAMQSFYRDLPKLVQDVLLVSGMVAYMAYANWALALSVLPCFALFYGIEPYLSGKTERWGKERAERSRQKDRQLYDSLVSLPEVRAYGAQAWNMDNVREKIDAFQLADWKTARYSLLRAMLRNVSITIGAAVLFAAGAYLIRIGRLQTGEFIAFSLIYFMAIGKFTFIFFRIAQLKVNVYPIAKVRQWMDAAPAVREPDAPVVIPHVRGSLELRDVGFAYPDRPQVLDRVNLQIAAGERIAFVGASGSGKTTLAKLIARFYDPQEGEIALDGVPIRQVPLKQLREAVGFLFQEPFLFATTVKENIRFAKPEADDEEIVAAAKAAGAHDFIALLPNGYETFVGERGAMLSGGQKQRIAIARLFLKWPPIVILDEATSALDSVSEAAVLQSLDKLTGGRTTIAIAHRLATVRDFDTIAVFDGGRLVEKGGFDELLARKGHLYRLAQARKNEADEGERNDEQSALDSP